MHAWFTTALWVPRSTSFGVINSPFGKLPLRASISRSPIRRCSSVSYLWVTSSRRDLAERTICACAISSRYFEVPRGVDQQSGRKGDTYEIAFHEYYVCQTYLPKVLDVGLKPYMHWRNTGMQLSVWLRKR